MIKGMMEKRGYAQIPSNGTSMFPLIKTGNICRFEPVHRDEIEAGDILLYVNEAGILVGHRFIRRIEANEEILYVCRGDSRRNEDPPLREDQILGKMVSIRKARVTFWMNSFTMIAWGKAVVHYPQLSASIDMYLRVKRKVQGMRQRLWAS